jgi:hypothetical protein
VAIDDSEIARDNPGEQFGLDQRSCAENLLDVIARIPQRDQIGGL